jgi:hypothetical protein
MTRAKRGKARRASSLGFDSKFQFRTRIYLTSHVSRGPGTNSIRFFIETFSLSSRHIRPLLHSQCTTQRPRILRRDFVSSRFPRTDPPPMHQVHGRCARRDDAYSFARPKALADTRRTPARFLPSFAPSQPTACHFPIILPVLTPRSSPPPSPSLCLCRPTHAWGRPASRAPWAHRSVPWMAPTHGGGHVCAHPSSIVLPPPAPKLAARYHTALDHGVRPSGRTPTMHAADRHLTRAAHGAAPRPRAAAKMVTFAYACGCVAAALAPARSSRLPLPPQEGTSAPRVVCAAQPSPNPSLARSALRA